MIPSNPIPTVCDYASSPTAVRALPSPEQIANGVIPLDSLPAAWWNCMWHDTNVAINCARYGVNMLVSEVNNVLACAGICACLSCTDQLLQAIECIRQTLGNATTAGFVKSSSCPSEVAIDQTTGMMSVNCLGNAASLTTSSHTIVSAVNELKSTYDPVFGPVSSTICTITTTKVPTSHVSDATTYGVGNTSCYGHLKISDTYNVDLGDSGMAASQKAVSDVYNYFLSAVSGTKECSNRWYIKYAYPHQTSACPSCPPLCTYGLATSGYIQPYVLSSIQIDDYARLTAPICGSIYPDTCFSAQRYYSRYFAQNICGYSACVRYETLGPISLYGPNAELVCGTASNCFIANCLALYSYSPAPILYNYYPECQSQQQMFDGNYFYRCSVVWGSPSKCWDCCASSVTICCLNKRTGAVALNFWDCFFMGPTGCESMRCWGEPLPYQLTPSDWCLNGHPLCGADSSQFPNFLGGTCCNSLLYRVYSNRESNSAAYHVHFNLYMNPLYIPGQSSTNQRQAPYLGSNNMCCDHMAMPFTGNQRLLRLPEWNSDCCIFPWSDHVAVGPSYGFHAYDYNAVCCTNSKLWLCCFSACTRSYQRVDCALARALANNGYSCLAQAPLYHIYIDS